jgi:hypothetical protein
MKKKPKAKPLQKKVTNHKSTQFKSEVKAYVKLVSNDDKTHIYFMTIL